jgi:CcmD family protein
VNPAVGAVLPQLPFVVGAYGIIWIVLFAYTVFIFTRVGRAEKQVSLLEEAMRRRGKLEAAEDAEAEQRASSTAGTAPAARD